MNYLDHETSTPSLAIFYQTPSTLRFIKTPVSYCSCVCKLTFEPLQLQRYSWEVNDRFQYYGIIINCLENAVLAFYRSRLLKQLFSFPVHSPAILISALACQSHQQNTSIRFWYSNGRKAQGPMCQRHANTFVGEGAACWTMGRLCGQLGSVGHPLCISLPYTL